MSKKKITIRILTEKSKMKSGEKQLKISAFFSRVSKKQLFFYSLNSTITFCLFITGRRDDLLRKGILMKRRTQKDTKTFFARKKMTILKHLKGKSHEMEIYVDFGFSSFFYFATLLSLWLDS